ncbi:MAG TPA: vWA domain-containing protein [Planctomycetota bacterium]|nr:vWA domain-containing protein [Planctomycetota bacterium]
MTCLVPRPGRRSERGLSFAWFAVVVVLIFGVAGLVIDGSHAYDVRTQCQATADAAALAAGLKLPSLVTAQAAALAMGLKNMDPLVHGTVIKAGDVQFGKWDFVAKTFTQTAVLSNINAVRVYARRSAANANPLALSFAKAIGFSSVDVQGKAVAAAAAGKPWSISLVQDVTSSFSAELAQARTADHNLLDCYSSMAAPGSRMGLITFTGWSQQLAPLSVLSTSYALLNSAVNAIKLCGSVGAPICSGTDIAAGLQAGTNMLTAAPPLAGVGKAIVMVTDGQPQPSTQGSHPTSTATQLKALATQWADNADAAGISVFIVYYDGDNDPAAKAFLQTLVRGEGIFLTTPDPAQIPALLDTICSKLTKLMLVE